jgi:hypothetical protein
VTIEIIERILDGLSQAIIAVRCGKPERSNEGEADMGRDTPVKVIKRDERERLAQEAARSRNSEFSAHEKAMELAANVKGWVSEFRQTRLAQRQETKQQLGWPMRR